MAIESFQHGKHSFPVETGKVPDLRSVLEHNPNDLDTKMKLAHAYEDLGNPVRALELVNEGKSPQLER